MDHSCCIVPVIFHLASVRGMAQVLAEIDMTVMSTMKSRGKSIVIIFVVTNTTDQSRIEIVVCYMIYK